jgi:hypothetical protein
MSGDSLRHSPLAHLLADTADALFVAPGDSAVDSVEAPAKVLDAFAQRETAIVREQALMAFARSLMQALRQRWQRDEEEQARQRPWGTAARPVGQLATRADGDDLARQHELLGAFAELRRVWGATDRADDQPAHERLHAFLHALAERMGAAAGGDWGAATQPGSLIDVRA